MMSYVVYSRWANAFLVGEQCAQFASLQHAMRFEDLEGAQRAIHQTPDAPLWQLAVKRAPNKQEVKA